MLTRNLEWAALHLGFIVRYLAACGGEAGVEDGRSIVPKSEADGSQQFGAVPVLLFEPHVAGSGVIPLGSDSSKSRIENVNEFGKYMLVYSIESKKSLHRRN